MNRKINPLVTAAISPHQEGRDRDTQGHPSSLGEKERTAKDMGETDNKMAFIKDGSHTKKLI